jgi:hypothetical protein
VGKVNVQSRATSPLSINMRVMTDEPTKYTVEIAKTSMHLPEFILHDLKCILLKRPDETR